MKNDNALINAAELTSPSMVISPNLKSRYNILFRFLSGFIESSGMHTSPSFSVTYSMMEFSEVGKSSVKIGILLEPLVSSVVWWGVVWSSTIFSIWTAVGGLGWSLKVKDHWSYMSGLPQGSHLKTLSKT